MRKLISMCSAVVFGVTALSLQGGVANADDTVDNVVTAAGSVIDNIANAGTGATGTVFAILGVIG